MSTHLLIIIFSSQKNFDASYDSGHEDMDEDDPNDHDFPHVSLFSVAMMMRKKVYDYINLQHYIRYVKHAVAPSFNVTLTTSYSIKEGKKFHRYPQSIKQEQQKTG